MLILPGSPALSAFRKEKLLEALPQAEALSARFVHFVEGAGAAVVAGVALVGAVISARAARRRLSRPSGYTALPPDM